MCDNMANATIISEGGNGIQVTSNGHVSGNATRDKPEGPVNGNFVMALYSLATS
jgi:hypothetical protein